MVPAGREIHCWEGVIFMLLINSIARRGLAPKA